MRFSNRLSCAARPVLFGEDPSGATRSDKSCHVLPLHICSGDAFSALKATLLR